MADPTGSLGQLVVQITTDRTAYQAGMQGVVSDARQAGAAVGAAGDVGAAGMDHVGSHTAAARKEMAVMLHEAATGNFKNLIGSAMVLGEQYDILGRLMSPVGVGVGTIAAAVLAFGVAAVHGAEQQDAFNRAVEATGGYAGVSAGQISGMADQLAALGVPVTKANDLLTQVVATGKISGDAITAVAEAASQLSQATGENAQAIIKQFADMSTDVAAGAAKMSEQYHFLTTAQYDEIKALQDHGDQAGAMKVAADALTSSLEGMKTPLGALPTLLHEAGAAWSQFWQAAMNIGKSNPNGDLDRLKAQLDELKTERAAAPGYGVDTKPIDDAIAQVMAQMEPLQHDADLHADSAGIQGFFKQEEQGALDAAVAVDRLSQSLDKNYGKRKALQDLQEQYAKLFNDPSDPNHQNQRLKGVTQNANGTFSGGQYDELVKGIDDKYKPNQDTAGNKVRKDSLAAALQTTRNGLDLINAAYKASDDQLAALHKANLISDQAFYEAEITAANDATAQQIAAYQQEKRTLQDAYWKAPAEDRIKITQQIGEVDTAIAKVTQENAAKTAVLLTQQTQAQRDYQKSIQDAHNALLAQAGDSVPQALASFDQKNRGNVLQAATTGDVAGAAFLDQSRQLTSLSAQYNDIVAQAKDAQTQISLDQQTGLTGLFDGFSQLRDNSASTVQSLQTLYDQVNKLSWQTTDEGVLRSLDQLRDKIRQSMLDSQGYFQDFADAGKSAFSSMFSDIVTGTKTPAQAVGSMVSSMLASFAQLFANKAYTSIVNGLFGSIFPASTPTVGGAAYGFTMPSSIQGSGALFGASAGLAFAGGGDVRGPGTGTSDSIDAKLSDGEFVVKESVVSKPGMRAFLQALNGGKAVSGGNRFASGGYVNGDSSSTSVAGSNVDLHIHNAPAGAQVQQSKSANGALRLDVILQQVDQHIASGIRTGRGATARSMQQQYGLNRTVGRT